MRDNGIRRAAVFTTSAWGGYSSCTQYVEDIARGRAARPATARRSWSSCASTSTIRCSSRCSPTRSPTRRDPARGAARRRPAGVHRALDSACGPLPLRHRPLQPPGRLRVPAGRRRRRATTTTTRCGSRGPGRRRCRGWNPMSPTTCRRLADAGTKAVIVCPIGFVADHIEVVWDLDNELRQQAEASGIAFARAPHAERRPPLRAAGCRPDRRAAPRPRTGSPGSQRPDAPPLQGFSINGAVCTPTAASPRRQAECRIALTAANRAERTTADSGRSASLAICTSDEALQADRHQPRTDGDDRVDVCGVLQHAQCPRWGMVGGPVPPGDSSTCSTSLRGSATSTPPASARMVPSASAADRTADRSAYSASPRSRCSAIGAPGSEYTVQTVRDSSAPVRMSSSNRRVVVFEVGHQADRACDGSPRDDDRLTGGHRVALELGARGQAADVAGHRQRNGDRRCAEPARPAAVRSVCSSDTAPASVQIRPGQAGAPGRDRVVCGHGMPWRPLG